MDKDDHSSPIAAYHDFLKAASEWLSHRATDVCVTSFNSYLIDENPSIKVIFCMGENEDIIIIFLLYFIAPSLTIVLFCRNLLIFLLMELQQ